eukprot:CAMPEP_0178785130 /NCGR_PEP_ID=MMETSP0745-20121128/4619_1 /TAXON_ID=913974 /ORGANISM="Nitzschia punctata, Strain CCMP561" /LENGTH=1231 /DNA_ID=CAMNT_0020442817 /DNA_START=31 /DNA_END=3727 /DNA_ORIENTATION=+
MTDLTGKPKLQAKETYPVTEEPSDEEALRPRDEFSERSGGYDSSTRDGESQAETSQSSEDRDNPAHAIFAQKESRNVFRSKMLVFFVLLLAAGSVGFFTYYFLSQEEQSDFETQFRDFSTEIIEMSNKNAEDVLGKLIAISEFITSSTTGLQQTWPNVTVKNWDVLTTEDFERTAGPELYLFAPFVRNEEKKAWQEYAVTHQTWIREDLFLRGMGDVDPGKISEEVYAFNYDTESFYDFSLPVWQVGPVPTNADMIMLDLYTQASFRRMVDDGLEVRHILLSEVVDRTFFSDNIQTIESDPSRDHHPRSFAAQPVFETFFADSQISAFVFSVVPWDTYFTDILPQGIEGFVVQVQDTCGSGFSYLLNGPEAVYLGEEYEQDAKFDYLVQTADFATFTRYLDNNTDVANNDIQYCSYKISVHATSAYADAFTTQKPMYLTIVVILVFVFTALVFVLYDYFVQRRQTKVMRTAEKTTAIVSSLFPKNVRKRILAAAMEEDSNKKSRISTSGKDKLKSFFDNGDESRHDGAKSGVGGVFDKPIADFFPETTIMFGDLVGFTAWSSTREPSQVFTLLETIYNEFDRVAKRRKVFKVETVGDCYVAVAGLPDPRKDHAVVMARFARECLTQLQALTHELEVSLGPDTADLAMRVGLHSGPVTAGVLRGERARFQLFGDTMNTASRMESTGVPNRIHVSAEFVENLNKLGKSHWAILREDQIYAKGKGSLKTYFLEFQKDVMHNTSDATSSNGENSDTPRTLSKKKSLHPAAGNTSLTTEAPGDKISARVERLVNWNLDLLCRLLKEIIACRKSNSRVSPESDMFLTALENEKSVANTGNVITEVKEIIKLPAYHKGRQQLDPESIELDPEVVQQLRAFIVSISSLYHDNPFHNFEHASHVTMSVVSEIFADNIENCCILCSCPHIVFPLFHHYQVKLFSRIIAPDMDNLGDKTNEQDLHDHTYGITSDPMTRFTVVLAALVHDADHPGVPNAQLVKEEDPMAVQYENKSVAEQNSVDLAWTMLNEPEFKALRRTIYQTEGEFRRFRELLVNTVLATDIMDKDLKQLRNARWEKAFSENGEGQAESERDMVNRKATIVIEHLIQASDVAHTMQHWHIYRKWNARLFEEMYKAYMEGRADKDPSEFWYKGEIGFLDFYVIPLAKKLKDCGVFGVSSDEYLQYAMNNRNEWEQKGEGVVAELVRNVKTTYNKVQPPQGQLPEHDDAKLVDLKNALKEDI